MYPNSELWNNEFKVKFGHNATQANCKNCKKLRTRLKKLERANRILSHQAGERYFGRRLGYEADKSLYGLPDLERCLTWPPRPNSTPPFTPDSILYDPVQSTNRNQPIPVDDEEKQHELQNIQDTPQYFPLKFEPQAQNMEIPINIYPNDSPIMNPSLWNSPLHLTTETPFSVTSDLSEHNMFMTFDSPFEGLNWEPPKSPWDPSLDLTVVSPFNADPEVEIPDEMPAKTADATTQTPGMCFCRIHF